MAVISDFFPENPFSISDLKSRNLSRPTFHLTSWIQQLWQVTFGINFTKIYETHAGMVYPDLIDVKKYSEGAMIRQHSNFLILKGFHGD